MFWEMPVVPFLSVRNYKVAPKKETCNPATMSGRPYLAQIDALRGIAAMLVACFYHIRAVYLQSGGLTPLSTFQPFYWLQFNGYLFVDLFFVISGVVFTHKYLVDGKMKRGVSFADFFRARIARLYPLHLFTLLVVAGWATNAPLNTLEAFFAHLFFLNVFTQNPTQTFNGPAWSLSVEMFCYLVFALAALWGRVGLVALACIFGGLLLALDPNSSGWTSSGLLARGLFGFFVGHVVYRLAISKHVQMKNLVLCSPLLSLPVFLDGLLRILAFSAFVWPAVIILSLRLGVLDHQIFRWLGERSYSIYLVHWPIFLLMATLFAYFELSPGWWGQFLAIVLVLMVSNTTYRAIELPAKELLKRYFGLEGRQ